MWLMSTFENENLKIIFFVSTFLDWYNRLLRNPCACPDLETFFRKMLFEHIFFRKNASQIGFGIPEEIAPPPYQKQPPQKPASGNERL